MRGHSPKVESRIVLNQDRLKFRQALSQYATGVTVVSALKTDGSPAGLTVNSFTSVSLDPPLILWCLGLDSSAFDIFSNIDRFAVNVLTADQMDLAILFASNRKDKFTGVAWQPGIGGIPLIKGSLATFECRLETTYPGGDHIILLGRVEYYSVKEGKPLLFHNSRFQ